MCLMLVFGTLNTVIMKMQDDVIVGTNDDGTPITFKHPYLQCAIMFLGELFCMFIYGVKCLWYKNTDPAGRAGVNPLAVAVPAMFDMCGSSLMFVALTMCAASVYQMMRGVIVVITAVMALVFLGKKQYAHHWISLTLIVLGIFIVGFVTTDTSSMGNSTSIVGIVLLLFA